MSAGALEIGEDCADVNEYGVLRIAVLFLFRILGDNLEFWSCIFLFWREKGGFGMYRGIDYTLVSQDLGLFFSFGFVYIQISCS